jgi:hypothetical protein
MTRLLSLPAAALAFVRSPQAMMTCQPRSPGALLGLNPTPDDAPGTMTVALWSWHSTNFSLRVECVEASAGDSVFTESR